MFSICFLAFLVFFFPEIESHYLNLKTLSTVFPDRKNYTFEKFQNDLDIHNKKEIPILKKHGIHLSLLVVGLSYLEGVHQAKLDRSKEFYASTGINTPDLDTYMSEEDKIRTDLVFLLSFIKNMETPSLIASIEEALWQHAAICHEMYEKEQVPPAEENPQGTRSIRETLYKIFDYLHSKYQEQVPSFSTKTTIEVPDYMKLTSLIYSNINIDPTRLTCLAPKTPSDLPPFVQPYYYNSLLLSITDEKQKNEASKRTFKNYSPAADSNLLNVLDTVHNLEQQLYYPTADSNLLNDFFLYGSFFPTPLISPGITDPSAILEYHYIQMRLFWVQSQAHLLRCANHPFEESIHNALARMIFAHFINLQQIQSLLNIKELKIIKVLNRQISDLLCKISYFDKSDRPRTPLPKVPLKSPEYLKNFSFENFLPKSAIVNLDNPVLFRIYFNHIVFEIVNAYFSSQAEIKKTLSKWEAKVSPIISKFNSLGPSSGVIKASTTVTLFSYVLFLHKRLYSNFVTSEELIRLFVSMLPDLQSSKKAVNTILYVASEKGQAPEGSALCAKLFNLGLVFKNENIEKTSQIKVGFRKQVF